MKKSIIAIALAALALGAGAENPVITLDLSKSTTPLSFNTENGSWTDTYNDDVEAIESQCFQFVHSSMGDYNTWWGFTASNSADNSQPTNTLAQQWSNMAKGGIALNDDGTVKTDEYGSPVVSAAMPYMVAFYSPYMARRPVDMTFNDGKNYEAIGVYVNLNSYSYYSLECGDSFARAFNRTGDKFTLTIHGVAPDETEKQVEVELASYDNGNLTINRGWRYVDLSSLGVVNELYFTMKSTDAGAYGDNTPEYFCLDKLMVREAVSGGVESVAVNKNTLAYDREAAIISLGDNEFAIVYDVAGNKLVSSEGPTLDVSGLDAGIYIVKAGNESLKFAK